MTSWHQQPSFDSLLTRGALVLLTLALGWAVAIGLAVLVEVVSGGRFRAALRWGCPPALHHRLVGVVAATVAALVSTVPAAPAADLPRPPGTALGTALDGLRLPDLPVVETSPRDSRAGSARPVSARVTVHPGDSLWRIGRRLLPARASPARVAATTRDLYALNRTLIGPDPHLIQPGQRLDVVHLEDETYSEDSCTQHHHSPDPSPNPRASSASSSPRPTSSGSGRPSDW